MSGLPTLELHLSRVRRHIVLLTVCILLGTAVGVWLVRLDQPLVTARASVLMKELPGYAQLDVSSKVPEEVTVDTDAALLGSTEVTDAVAEASGVDPDIVQERLAVTATPLTSVLHISFSAPDAESAAAGATTAAKTLLQQRSSVLAGAAKETVDDLRVEVAAIRDEIKRNLSREEPTATSANELLLGRLQFLVRFLDDVRSANQSMGQLLSQARTVGTPKTVNPEVKVSGGGMVGLLVGLGLSLAVDAWRGRRRQWTP